MVFITQKKGFGFSFAACMKVLAVCFAAIASLRGYAQEFLPGEIFEEPAEVVPFVKQPQFIAIEQRDGWVLPTNKYISHNRGPKAYSSISFKYGMLSRGDRWEDLAYGMPYGGIGFWGANFYNCEREVGNPMALYVFSGARMARISRRIHLNYEWNLGMSFGWTPYDPFTNPNNIAIGSSVNVFVGFDIYLKWTLTPVLDLDLGVNLTHCSNGDSRQPNAGMNMAAPMFALVCNFNRPAKDPNAMPCLIPPVFQKRIDHDLMFIVSSRQAQIDTTGTGLPTQYIPTKFAVLGLSYAMLVADGYKFKWGPGVDFVYDESAGVKVWRQVNPADGKLYERTKLGPASERVSLGLSARGELMMARYSIFANFGWNVLWGNRADARLYQVIGLKVYLKDNMFGTFGIRASHFSQSQFLYWSLGYTLAGKPRHPKPGM